MAGYGHVWIRAMQLSPDGRVTQIALTDGALTTWFALPLSRSELTQLVVRCFTAAA